ncbi:MULTISPECIES: hypothetical protein [Cyanophyceae]|uniref:hypothetical protein n=1 Tax=Cyanophyceae TaxID=3028117 RepID=UPI001683A410|nr:MULTISPECIES: hypothetical protein [Cyanophyceae]MBD1917008.1 hypothetical protein [Phormidium sp. FACHB-77]MBD2029859.1 hypothetical protein [Phormidium sp. FACHB-322]MBD2050353.1 hypothetical protein [Leptolyngbya sp. FACHB-60]
MREFYDIVQAATDEQRHELGELVGSGFGGQPDTLCDHIKYLRAGTIGQLFWQASWKQVVTDVADHVGIDWLALLSGRHWQELPTEEIEAAVVAKLFHDMFDQLSPDQQQKVVMEMHRHGDDSRLEALFLGGGAMAAAKMSGFGVYLMASTVLGGLTNVMGLTLPFAVYIGMSQAIALVLGPVGWAALASGIVWTLNQPNWERLTLGVVYVSLLRNNGIFEATG